MKAIQITVDEELLQEIDASPEAMAGGRSALFRRAAADYLRRQKQAAIRQRYIDAYRGPEPLGEEFAGWEEQGEWPAG